ncbi:MAG: glycosyltransferase family 32 protein [Labrys sp. (in: a-proteobacteria)]
MPVPGTIFQILIADRPLAEITRSGDFERNAGSLKATYPNATYTLYGHDDLLAFIAGNFPAEVLDAFTALRPFAFKADLARCCLLYKLGGLYSDLSYLHLRPITVEADTDLVVFRDAPIHPSWATSNAIIYARPQCEVLERAIARIVSHHKAGFLGISPLEPTGPYMFGRVLAETTDWRRIVFGDSPLVNVDRKGRHNILKVMPGGEIVAIRNKIANSSIKDLVGAGGNDYSRLWEKGEVWGDGKPMGTIGRLMAKITGGAT